MTDELGVGALIARLADQPAWLRAALDADRVAGVPATRVTGLWPQSAKLRRLVLRDDGHWEGTYELGVEDGRGGKRPVRLLGTLTPPGEAAAVDPGGRPRPSASLAGGCAWPSWAWTSRPSRRRSRSICSAS